MIHQTLTNTDMTNQAIINGITFNILAEISFDLNSNMITRFNSPYVSSLVLKRPNGNKKFNAMRDVNGNLSLDSYLYSI